MNEPTFDNLRDPMTAREMEIWRRGFRCGCGLLRPGGTKEAVFAENQRLRMRLKSLRVLMGQLEARRIVPGETA